jgi:ATP-dependent DNA helicase RecG
MEPALFDLDRPLASGGVVPPRFVPRLKKLGIETVRDLLWHFPTRYEDFSRIVAIGAVIPGEHVTISGTIKSCRIFKSFRKKISILEVVISDGTGTVYATWFNQPYLKTTFTSGIVGRFAGKISITPKGAHLTQPSFELVGQADSTPRHTGRLVAVYPETHGLTSKGLRFLIQTLLDRIHPPPEWIPESLLAHFGFPTILDGLRAIHTPRSKKEADAAQRRFGFEQLFLLHIESLLRKKTLLQTRSIPLPFDVHRMKEIIATLPFVLTRSQKKALWDFMQDIAKPHPANRLLQGDVGSGKTIVALLGALIAHANDTQTALMAPTEVLARQHFETAYDLFNAFDWDTLSIRTPGIALLTGHDAVVSFGSGLRQSLPKKHMLAAISRGEVHIVFGTHALIQKNISFARLGLVVVDEQHRFGIAQRAHLARRRTDSLDSVPHVLSMSATPIPRTLALTLLADVDLSVIDELPKNRKSIITRIIGLHQRSEAYEHIRREIVSGRQAFVICPRIQENSDLVPDEKAQRALDAKSVITEFQKLSTDIFPDLRVGMLHGQMKPAEKQNVMELFSSGSLDVLVSTSVIEVGVNIPNATVMAIEDSDRFGLAQLYQFRGRVGRGEHQSYCFLFSNKENSHEHARLQAMLTAQNGFELAEMDLRLRGPGEFIGSSANQTGMPDGLMHALTDRVLVQYSRTAAQSLLAVDPTLAHHPRIKERLKAFSQELFLE